MPGATVDSAVGLWPAGVVLHAASQRLEIRWRDGVTQQLSAAGLREHCPCSGCEAARRAQRRPPGDATLQAVHAAGEYGLQLAFSDGHDRGIYPWAYLRGLNDACVPGPPAHDTHCDSTS